MARAARAATVSEDISRATPSPRFLNAKASLQSIIEARGEVAAIVDALKTASTLGVTPPWRALKTQINTGALASLRDAVAGADAVAGPYELSEVERATWLDLLPSMESETQGRLLPNVSRPNELLCAVFSCQNSPRQPAGTDSLLTVSMLRKGIELGSKGDKRATALGVLSTAEAAMEKMDSYIAFLEERLLTQRRSY